jgi:hypothetical protein
VEYKRNRRAVEGGVRAKEREQEFISRTGDLAALLLRDCFRGDSLDQNARMSERVSERTAGVVGPGVEGLRGVRARVVCVVCVTREEPAGGGGDGNGGER